MFVKKKIRLDNKFLGEKWKYVKKSNYIKRVEKY